MCVARNVDMAYLQTKQHQGGVLSAGYINLRIRSTR